MSQPELKPAPTEMQKKLIVAAKLGQVVELLEIAQRNINHCIAVAPFDQEALQSLVDLGGNIGMHLAAYNVALADWIHNVGRVEEHTGVDGPTCPHEVLLTDGCLKCGRVIHRHRGVSQ